MSQKDKATTKNSWEFAKGVGTVFTVTAFCSAPVLLMGFLVPISFEAGLKLADKMFK